MPIIDISDITDKQQTIQLFKITLHLSSHEHTRVLSVLFPPHLWIHFLAGNVTYDTIQLVECVEFNVPLDT